KTTFKATVHIPEKVLVETLSRLPIRSLVQCKCISKSWTKLISDLHFIEKHLMNRVENDQDSQESIS
ncbi:hypothetical protein MTR67_046782, partial [Solanum verrucosum]